MVVAATSSNKPCRVAIVSGEGINCETETKHAFEKAGAEDVRKIHVNDLIANPNQLKNFDVLAFPGGFSYGDHLGSATGFVADLKTKNNGALHKAIQEFNKANKPIIGICNGFQILTRMGLLPGSLTFNERKDAPEKSARFDNRWVNLSLSDTSNKVVDWFKDLPNKIALPIAHGEGRWLNGNESYNNPYIAKYASGDLMRDLALPEDPNGSQKQIAALTNLAGNVLGMMPHPERFIDKTQHPLWTKFKNILNYIFGEGRLETPGLTIFKNIVNHVKEQAAN